LPHLAQHLQLLDRARQIIGALAQFAEQPRIFHCDHRLRGEVLQQCNLLVGERPYLLAIDRESPEERAVFAQWYNETGARAAETVERVRGSGRRVLFFTNGTGPTPARYAADLRSLGFSLADEEFTRLDDRARPTRISVERSEDGTSTRLDLAWRAAPKRSRSPRARAGKAGAR
jgi:hypothetical protein